MISLLDTDVVSQRVKKMPDERVARWMGTIPDAEIYVSVLSLVEIRQGIERMQPGQKREKLEMWLTTGLPQSFAGRVLPVDAAVADVCGRLVAHCQMDGHTPDLADALIAATAKVHGMRVATLNTSHFERLGVELVEW